MRRFGKLLLILLVAAPLPAHAQIGQLSEAECEKRAKLLVDEHNSIVRRDAAEAKEFAAQVQAGQITRPLQTSCAKGRDAIARAEFRRAKVQQLEIICGTPVFTQLSDVIGKFIEKQRAATKQNCAKAAEEN